MREGGREKEEDCKSLVTVSKSVSIDIVLSPKTIPVVKHQFMTLSQRVF